MSRSKVVRSLVLLSLLGESSQAVAEELTPELVARIQDEQSASLKAVNVAHGNKKPSQMDTAERRDVIREQAEAQQKILSQHDVAPKDYARYVARLSLEDRKRVTEETQRRATEKKSPLPADKP